MYLNSSSKLSNRGTAFPFTSMLRHLPSCSRITLSATYVNPFDIVELAPELPPLVKALTQEEHDAQLTAEQRRREQVQWRTGTSAELPRLISSNNRHSFVSDVSPTGPLTMLTSSLMAYFGFQSASRLPVAVWGLCSCILLAVVHRHGT